MNYKRGLVAGLVLPGALLLASCGSAGTSAGGGSDGSGARLDVVTAFYPFQFVAEQVAGDHATVTSLTQPGAEPHDLELTPRQVGSLAEADLVVYEQGFQPAVDEAVTQSGAASVLDTTTVVPLQTLAEEEAEHATEGEHAEDHADDEDHADGEDHAEDEHAHGGLDPHVWLDPTRMATIAGAVADRLATADPDHAADYRARAEALSTRLGELDASFADGLARCERTEFVTTHTAFGYLAARYGLTQIGIAGLSPDAEPSPARIAEVQQLAREHGVTTVFYETLVSPAIAESIAGDLGLRTDVLDPIEGITDASRGQDYVAVMEANLTALRSANGCA